MAGLEVVIGADIDDLKTGIAKAQTEIEKLTKLKSANIKIGIDTTDLQKQINESKNKLDALKKSLASTGSAIQGFAPKVANGGNALMQFSRIAQDAPYGIIGIGNNITATVESFGHLKQATGSSGAALKAMASSLLGSGGILLAVSLVTTGLTYMSQNGITVSDVFKMLTGDFDGYADALKRVNEESYKDAGVTSAIENVNELRINIDLAKNGFLDKAKVVEQYNETIGKTTGLVSSLDEAEKQLTSNADAYIKMTLYKAAANIALEAASKQILEAERSRIKKLSEFTNAFLDADLTQTRSAEQYNAKQESLKRQQENRKKAEIKLNTDAAQKNIDIAKRFQNDAAKIAKDFNFNFFGDTKSEKTKKPAKTFSTPQVSGIKSSVSPNNDLIDLNTIKTLTGEVDKFGNKITELPNVIKTGMDKTKIALDTGFIDALETMQKFNDDANAIIVGSLTSTFTNLGTAIGDALASGKNVFGAIGNSLLASLGGFLSEMGALLIKYGVLAVAKGTLDVAMTVPVVGIAAGAAAIAVGVALSAAGGAMSSRAKQGTSGSGGMSTGGSYSSPASTSSYTSSGGGMGSGTVVFEISGTSLVGVLSNTLDKNKRLGGNLPI
jgi:hypothetical protein